MPPRSPCARKNGRMPIGILRTASRWSFASKKWARLSLHSSSSYNDTMADTKALEKLIERAAALPDEAQAEFVDAVAEAMELIETKHSGVHRLSEDERYGIERGLREMRQRRFANDEAVAAVFRRARDVGA